MQQAHTDESRELAVVLGGSIAGLLTAAALQKHYRRVLVVERDPQPAEGGHRRGVPQSHHPHQLLDGARSSFEKILPGFDAELIVAGAEELNPGLCVAHLEPWGWSPRKPVGETMLYASRLLIEETLRKRVSSGLPRLEIPAAASGSRPVLDPLMDLVPVGFYILLAAGLTKLALSV